ncbi:MAG TPA: hypothetical protein VLJ42_03650 [Solirubrobacteraceae bacterium]|nr:hypothetical protein [Solirubrobacteraceae bacterium]
MATANAWAQRPIDALAANTARDWLRIALLSAAAAGVFALVGVFALGRLPLNLYDVSFTLNWGRELIHGQVPDVQVSGASTPHPLSIASGAFAALFGGDALDAMRGLLLVAGGAVGVALLAMGRAFRSVWIGVIAAVVLMVSEPFVQATLGQATASDLPSLAAVFGALALELSRPKRGAAPLVLLAVAGLWRPEAWLLSGVYWLYLAPGRDWRSRAQLAVLALSAPLLWAFTDLLLTGNPLYSLIYTRDATEAANRPTGFTNVPAALRDTLTGYFSTPVLIGAVLGVALDLWLRRLPRLLVAAVLLTIVGFAAVGAANMPLDNRYALPTTVLAAVYFGFFTIGWREQPGGWLKRAWMGSAAVVAVLALVIAPSSLGEIAHDRHSLSAQAKIEGQLDALLKPVALRRQINSCGPLQASYRIVPILAYDLGRAPRTIATVNYGVPATGTVVEPTPGLAERLFETHAHPISSFTDNGYRVAGSNESWIVYTRCS